MKTLTMKLSQVLVEMNHKIPTYHKRSFNVKDVKVKKYYLRKAIT